jgi:hypothetical protein
MMKRNNFGFKKYQKPPHLSNLWIKNKVLREYKPSFAKEN